MEIRSEKESLETFKRLLISRQILTDREAEMYMILVDLGQATATEIHRKLKQKPEFGRIARPTVHVYLETLRTYGFAKVTAASGKRKHSKIYKANPPEGALKNHFDDNETLKVLIGDVVAKLEINNQKMNGVHEQNLWVYEPQEPALLEGIRCLKNARKSIAIYCNDYSLIVQQPSIGQLLRKKIKDGVTVRLLGAPPKDTVRNTVAQFDRVRKETSIPCMPYCIVDGQDLLLVLNENFGSKLFTTQNGYMVDHFTSNFDKIWNEYGKAV